MTRPTSVLTAGVSLILAGCGNLGGLLTIPKCRRSRSTVIQGTLENTLNDLDHGGYVLWELRYIDVQDPQDPEPKKSSPHSGTAEMGEQLPK